MREDGKVKELVDLLAAAKDLPETGQTLRANLIEEVASYDDVILEKFLAEEEVGKEEIIKSLQAGV